MHWGCLEGALVHGGMSITQFAGVIELRSMQGHGHWLRPLGDCFPV
jgi:hypothetical protein